MDQQQPTVRRKRNVNAALAAGKKSSNGARKKTAGRKATPAPKNAAPPAARLPSNLLSISSLSQLSTLCKQCIKYLQQADIWLDTLYRASNTLNETGLLKKIMQTKGKGLSTGDLAGLLLAFMNTPLADQFFKGGASDTAQSQETAKSAPSAQAPAETQWPSPSLPVPQRQNPGYPVSPGAPGLAPQPQPWPAPMPGYGTPPQYPNAYPPFPGYPYPPAAGQNPRQNG